MDGLVEALGESKDGDERGTPWIVSARASLAEGFAAAQRETARAEALLSLEYPQCAIPLEAGSIALVASFPDDDGEVRNAWAARVANAAARGGVRRATVGDGVARAALVDALSIAGIEVRPVNEPRPSRSFRLPWQRR